MAKAKRGPKQTGGSAPPPERFIFGANLRRARLAAGLTQSDLRERTGLMQPFISEVENSISSINLDNAAQLARAVGEPLWRLLVPDAETEMEQNTPS